MGGESKHKKKKHTKKGIALVSALILLAVLSMIFLSMIQYVSTTVRFSLYESRNETALNIAEAGIHFYRWYIAHQLDGLNADQVQAFWESTSPYPYGVDAPYVADFEGLGEYSITVTPPQTGSTSVIIESTGSSYTDSQLERTIRVRLRRPAWSEFVILSDSDLDLPDGTETFGPIHSNGGVRFDGVAHNSISSAVSTYDYGGSEKPGVWTSWFGEYNTNMASNVFSGGKGVGVGEEDFDATLVNFQLMYEEADDIGLAYGKQGQGHQVVLDYDEVDIYRLTGAAVNKKNGTVKDSKKKVVALNVPLPDIGVIYVGKNVWVEGVLGTGKQLSIVTIHSGNPHGTVFLSDDITYEDYTSGTILGLVAINDIEIVKNSDTNLRVDAVMLAHGGGVYRTDTSSKNQLDIYGAIVTNTGFDVNGYSTVNLIYDTNLLYNAPPFFPSSGEYELDLWEEL